MWTSPNADLDFNVLNELALVSLDEGQLLNELSLLQKTFTTHREQKLKNYADEQRAVAAYFLYYFPTNIPKFDFIFGQLSKAVQTELTQLDFYDIGSGPGTFSFAFLRHAGPDYRGEVHLVDSSELMLKQAKRLLDHAYPKAKIHYHLSLDPSLLERQKSLLFFGHSLNEMEAGLREKYFKRFKGEAVAWIEPGTFEVFHDLIIYREQLYQQGFHTLYPCLGHKACPAVHKQVDEWCHQVLFTQHPVWLERLSQKLKLDRRQLPLMAHVYMRGREQKTVGDLQARLVRIKKPTKHSFEWEVCLEREELGLQWLKISVPFKTLDKAKRKEWEKISVGIELALKKEKELAPDYWRVSLIE